MNQLTDTIELAKQAGFKQRHNSPVEWWMMTEDIEAFRALVIEAEHKRLLADAGGVCSAYQYLFNSPYGPVWRNDSDSWNGNRPIDSRELYTAATLAAARLQDQHARQQAQIENESLKARIARADAEKASEVLPLKKRIAELEAQLAESGYSACDMATAAAQGFRD